MLKGRGPEANDCLASPVLGGMVEIAVEEGQEGQEVEKGGLIVLEAMNAERQPLHAHRTGTVRS
ncbi:hypothetical protein ACFWJY_07650 [Streptomyces anulatus]|uniref:hypothetical protein n=1 Tax=Streptomyces anulatus TaxID=1892 RepID=UPI0036554DBC